MEAFYFIAILLCTIVFAVLVVVLAVDLIAGIAKSAKPFRDYSKEEE